MSQFAGNPFEPLRFHDAPTVIASQILDGEFTMRGGLNALFSPQNLTLAERETYVTRLKEQLGRNSISDAFVDIATNPFVWLTFLTSPVGGTALARAGRGIFSPSNKYASWAMEQAPFLAPLLSPMQHFEGSAITPTLMSVARGIENMDGEVSRKVVPHLADVVNRNNLKSLDPEMNKAGVQRETASRINDTVDAWLRGMDTEWTEYTPRLSVGRDGKSASFKMDEVRHQRLVQADLEAELKRMGAWDLATSYRDALNDRWVRLFGRDDLWDFGSSTGKFVVDEAKTLTLVRGLQNPLTSGKLSLNQDTGADVVAQLFGADMGKAIADGIVSGDDFLNIVRQVADAPIRNARSGRSFYMPRNLIDVNGGGLGPQALRQVRESRTFVATRAATPRTPSSAVYDPEDLRRMGNRFGATRALHDLEEAATSTINSARGSGGGGVYVHRFNAAKSLERYFNDSGNSHALYVQSLAGSPTVRIARNDMFKAAAGDENVQAALKAVQESRDSLQSSGRYGYDSLADVLFEQHSLIPQSNKYGRRMLSDVVLPRMTGRLPRPDHQASLVATLSGKRAVGAVLDAGVRNALSGQGRLSQGLLDRLESFADLDTPMQSGRGLQAQVARYLYVTHLGVNPASVALNMSQPWLLGATWLGADAIAAGYRRALPEMMGYLQERLGKHGIRPINDADHAALHRKHFRFADEMDIGKDAFDSLDQIAFASRSLGRAGRAESILFDYPMKLFEKAEILNRSVIAHATEFAYEKAGRKVVRPTPTTMGNDDYYRLSGDVQRMIGETQFGGSILNTPMLFQDPSRSILANPLMRQFLSFPLRSFTGIFHQSSRVGGRTNRVLDPLRDFGRGIGISAIIYESTKATLGADLSRGLIASATTDIVGGERILEDGNEFVPVPPIVDIPVSLFRSFATGDRELLSLTIPRLIPGGVAINRALNMAPQAPSVLGGMPQSLQRTYVDWSMKQPDGRYPVFRGDGMLVDYRGGSELVLRGLGADLSRFQSQAELDGFLTKQRDQIVEARRMAIAAYLANDVRKGDAIRAQFQRRFGMPLTITQQQLRNAIKNRRVPRTERILDRIPRDVRPEFTKLVANTRPEALQLTREQLLETETSRQREQLRRQNLVLNPETTERLREVLAEQERQEEAGRSFVGFGP